MSNKDYFGKIKTGGSNSSKGFAYQDLCAAFYLLKHLSVSGFKSIGIETDDDFSLLFDNGKKLMSRLSMKSSRYQLLINTLLKIKLF